MSDPIKQGLSEAPVSPVLSMDFENLSIAELCARIKRPTTPLEILANIKFVMDHDLLLQESFYTQEILSFCFGGEKTVIDQSERNIPKCFVRGWVSEFSKIFPPVAYGQRLGDGLDFLVNRIYEDTKLVHGMIHWSNSQIEPTLTFENLVKILGAPDRTSFIPVGHQNLLSMPSGGTKTHRHGGETAEYMIQTPRVTRIISMKLFLNGTLYLGNFGTKKNF